MTEAKIMQFFTEKKYNVGTLCLRRIFEGIPWSGRRLKLREWLDVTALFRTGNGDILTTNHLEII